MEGERVRTFWNFDDNRIVRPLVRVVLGQLNSQAPRLYPDRRVALRIESRRAAQDFSGNLIFLQRNPGMIQRMFREVTEELAQRFRGVQAMTFNKFIYLLEALLPTDGECLRYSHITRR